MLKQDKMDFFVIFNNVNVTYFTGSPEQPRFLFQNKAKALYMFRQ